MCDEKQHIFVFLILIHSRQGLPVCLSALLLEKLQTDFPETWWAGWTRSREEPIKSRWPDGGSVVTTFTFWPTTFEPHVTESKI